MQLNLAENNRARLATSMLTMQEMIPDNGIELPVNILDCVFLQDNNWCCFYVYLSFILSGETICPHMGQGKREPSPHDHCHPSVNITPNFDNDMNT